MERLQGRPGVSSYLPGCQGLRKVLTKSIILCASLNIRGPSQEQAGTFRGCSLGKKETSGRLSFPELVIGNPICTRHIKSNPFTLKKNEAIEMQRGGLWYQRPHKFREPVFKAWLH